MSYSANLDQMLDALQDLNAPEVAQFVRILEDAGTAMAQIIAKSTGIGAGDANRDHSAFGGTIAAFWPMKEGQEIPECLTGTDDEDQWEYDAETATTPAA